LGDHTLC